MRHRVKKFHLNRDTNHRKALFVNMGRQLVEHGTIVTSRQKAKAIKRIADKMVAKAKKDSVSTRRQLHRFFGKRDIVNVLVEKVAPAHKDNVGGVTRIKPHVVRRGDTTKMVKLSFVNEYELPNGLKAPEQTKKKATKKKSKTTKKKKTTKKAK